MDFKSLVSRTAQATGLSKKKVREVVLTFFDELGKDFTKARPGEKIRTPIGVFKVVRRAPRKGRNPRTGEEVQIPAKKILIFKLARKLIIREG